MWRKDLKKIPPYLFFISLKSVYSKHSTFVAQYWLNISNYVIHFIKCVYMYDKLKQPDVKMQNMYIYWL